MNVLVILGHPRKDSYCAALAAAYIRGAIEAGAEVEYLILAELDFEMNVVVPSPQKQHAEEDILRSRKLIKWADHLVFVYPTWWGNMPALLKAFLDRVITPGFAFREIQPDAFEKLLAPRTAQIMTTMDTPPWVDRVVNGAPSVKALANATLKFCGVVPVRIWRLAPIKHSDAAQKAAWLQQAYHKGKALKSGVRTPAENLSNAITPWIKAIRLQFYPMTFLAYTIGTFAFSGSAGEMDWPVFICGYLLIFLIEVVVVFTNDYYDQETDRLNRAFSPFSGGSRVLVDGLITESSFKKAIRIGILFTLLLTIALAWLSPTSFLTVFILVSVLYALALSYTVPPLKLSYRGWGELLVGFTHSFAVILCGFVFQGGAISNPDPWLLGTPLFLAIIPAIILAGIPDHDADKIASKGTLAVRLGKEKAAGLAILLVILSVITLWISHQSVPWSLFSLSSLLLVSTHAACLCYVLFLYIRKTNKPKRIDGVIALALSYILWYTILPFVTVLS